MIRFVKTLAATSLLLLTHFISIPAVAQNVSLERDQKEAVVEKIGDLLTVNYVFPDRAALAKAKVAGALAAGDYDKITDAIPFAQRLTADLQSITHDRHMRVLAGLNLGPPAGVTPPPPTNAGFARVDRLTGNIGYIKLLGFPGAGPFNLASDQAMKDLASTDALIIDMRDNGGGRPESVSYLCSFFFDPKSPVHLNDLIYRKPGTNEFTKTEFWTQAVSTYYGKKPVYLLTSKRTFSGGEEFVNDLKVQKRAKVFGETTGGGANPGGVLPIDRQLGIGIFIPSGRAENPITKTSWEGSGITPDVTVDEKLAFQAAVLDILGKRQDATAVAIKRGLATQNDVDPFVETHLLTFRASALPGSAAAVRRNLEEIARGTPNYDRMSSDLANVTKAQLPMLQADVSKLGDIKTVTFEGVGPDGLDVYEVSLTNGALQCGIFLTPDGKIVSAWMRPAGLPIPAAR